MRKILFIIFGLSVVVSHYSMNFILLALITFVYVLTLIISLPFVKKVFAFLLTKGHIKIKNTFNNNAFLSLPLILLLFLMTFLWNNLYTNTSNHTGSVLSEVISGLFVKSDQQSNAFSYTLLSFSKPDPNQQLQKYIQTILNSEGNINADQFYSKTITSKYSSYSLPQEPLAPTQLGILLTALHIPVFNIQAELRSFCADFMQIFVFIGWLAFFFFKGLKGTIEKIIPPKFSLKMRRELIQRSPWQRQTILPAAGPVFGLAERVQLKDKTIENVIAPTLALKMGGGMIQRSFLERQATLQLQGQAPQLPYSMNSNVFDEPWFGNHTTFAKNEKKFDMQFLLLCLGSIFLLVLITLLPALSVEYGVLRMFQQLLFMLSLPIVLGVCSILFFLKEQIRILFTGIIAIIFFLNLTGFLSHLTGDYYPQMTLDNAGLYYDTYYVDSPRVVAIVWLSENAVKNDPIVTDSRSTSNLLAYGGINASDENIPVLVPKNAYVYLLTSSYSVIFIDSNAIYYNSDEPFINNNKNTIYSNGEVNIYK